MFKKLLMSLAFVSIGSALHAADDVVSTVVNNPIIRPGDADTLAQNFASIGTNLYQIAENTARILVHGTVRLSSGLAQGTKFMADHPIFGLSCIAGVGYTWYKWREQCACFRRVHNRDMTLQDLWRTTSEHWVPRRP